MIFDLKPGADAELFEWGLSRFIAEAQVLAQFKHPHIVRVVRYFVANRTAYIVMDYERGESLAERLARTPAPLPEPFVRGTMLALAAGLVQNEQGSNIVIEPGLAHRIVEAAGRECEKLANSGHQAILLCSSRVRRPFKKLTERMIPSMIVLSYSEIAPNVDVQALGMVEVTDED